jgi:EAL and modified HD-GYP domain-containing signal transduction protein
MDVFVARQAILNRQRDLYGYELLFRSGPANNSYDGTDSSSATSQVIANTLFSAGLEGILCGKKAFINFDRKMLLDGSLSILPKDTLVIEILETVEPDEEVIAACARLRENGFTLALDDFVHHPRFEPVVEKVHIIKVDLRRTSRPEQKRLVVKYGKYGIRMLAEKVETLEEFEWARGVGFDFFQGYFFTKPVIIRGRNISTSKMACLRLLQESQREEIDFDKLRALIKDDVSFSYKLLHFTNSALFAHQAEIRTIEHALMVLGEDGIRRWVAIAALAGLAQDKPHELIVHSLLRARFSEEVSRLARVPAAQNYFLMGLFSLLDALLDRSIEYSLQQIKLAPPVEEALLGTAHREDRMAVVYSLIRCYEAADWDEVASLAQRLGVTLSSIGNAYVESARWVAEVTGLVGA